MSQLNQPAAPHRTWRLTVSYDGTDYHGWQVQPDRPTIQGELQAALGRITGETPLPQGSGRTDAGVHALAQVASFALHAPIPPENLHRALNRTLPAPIRVLEARVSSDSFHARHSAVAKTYEYRIFRGEICPPFLARYVYTCNWPLDVPAMRQAASHFMGEHDFRTFAASDPDLSDRKAVPVAQNDQPLDDPRGTIRTIFRSEWESQISDSGELLVYRVRGNGFLHHMVRNLVGTMLDVGRGHFKAGDIQAILDARQRSAAGPTAPARGLFLHSVEYGDDKTAAADA